MCKRTLVSDATESSLRSIVLLLVAAAVIVAVIVCIILVVVVDDILVLLRRLLVRVYPASQPLLPLLWRQELMLYLLRKFPLIAPPSPPLRRLHTSLQ